MLSSGESIGKIGWPKCGEIDIMEQVNTENKIFGTLHWFTSSPTFTGHAQYGLTTQVGNTADWHVYAVEWSEKKIRVLVDEREYFVMDISDRSALKMFHEK